LIICPSFVRTLSRYVLSWNGNERITVCAIATPADTMTGTLIALQVTPASCRPTVGLPRECRANSM
jgi:hypothetical protein